VHGKVELYIFPDNIGHHARGGGDGWGRAFSKGLWWATEGGFDFDYVVHIEGDSLFRLPVTPICEQMKTEGIECASIPVDTGGKGVNGWVETGLMFFSVPYLQRIDFITKYAWEKRKTWPEIFIADLLGKDLRYMDWRGARDDHGQMTHENVQQYDWITHCHDPQLYETWLKGVTYGEEGKQSN
jgi:hypothetical protein